MSPEPSQRPDELVDAIAAFRKLLEVLPDDLLALESLFEAYCKRGDAENALQYLDHLIKVLLKENAQEAATELHQKLTTLAADMPEFAPFATRLEPLLVQTVGRPEATIPPTARAAPRQQSDIQAELALAWKLFQATELSQEDYSQVVQDLTEVSMRGADVPVSVLHALQDRSYKHLDKVMGYLSKQSGKPIITLPSFEIPREVFTLLPLNFMSHWGAIVFEALGPDLLVALLNPFDQVLQQEVASLTGKTCHFFLVSAADYDQTLTHIRKALKETASPAGG
jgi:tetratricopeptide (TPR) repeat protein